MRCGRLKKSGTEIEPIGQQENCNEHARAAKEQKLFQNLSTDRVYRKSAMENFYNCGHLRPPIVRSELDRKSSSNLVS